MFKQSKYWWPVAIIIVLFSAAYFHVNSTPAAIETTDSPSPSTPMASAAVNALALPTITQPPAPAPAIVVNIEEQTPAQQLSLPSIAVSPTLTQAVAASAQMVITPTVMASTHQISLQELLVHLSAAVAINSHKIYTSPVQADPALLLTPTLTITQPAAPSPETVTPIVQDAPPQAPIEPVADGVVRIAHVPILMYHYVSVPPVDANAYRLDLSVTPALFAQHLDRMLAEGYTTISLYQLYDNLVSGAPLPEKPVILTFDDGYRDVYENAFPLLRERGMTATLFIVTDFIDEQRPEYLTWDMARAMLAGGLSIESHGRNHISLKNKDADYLVWQALGSLETIQYELGVRPRFVSYPAGEYDQQTIDLFKSANYWAGLTTIQGATHHSDDLFQLHRVRVRGTTEPAELIRLLELDW
ncbi:MAG: polysaccharide deacetylase family protein [Caldilineaceae bacterium]